MMKSCSRAVRGERARFRRIEKIPKDPSSLLEIISQGLGDIFSRLYKRVFSVKKKYGSEVRGYGRAAVFFVTFRNGPVEVEIRCSVSLPARTPRSFHRLGKSGYFVCKRQCHGTNKTSGHGSRLVEQYGGRRGQV